MAIVGRRQFISALGGATVAWPLGARAQQPLPVIGFLHSGSAGPLAYQVAAFNQGLNETGYVEGQNVAIEYRWAEGHNDRLSVLAADLVQRQVAVIAATGGTASALSAKASTSTIPIVFLIGDDPVKYGLAASLNHPGGNATGMTLLSSMLGGKRLEIMRELMPGASKIAVLVNQQSPRAEADVKDIQDAARVLRVGTESEIESAFATFVREGAGMLLVNTDTLFMTRRDELIALAARHGVAAIYFDRQFAAAGGLMSYGTNISDVYRQVSVYIGRILKGEKPADLPVQQPTKFEFVINLKTAKSLGLEIPAKLLALADEVIE